MAGLPSPKMLIVVAVTETAGQVSNGKGSLISTQIINTIESLNHAFRKQKKNTVLFLKTAIKPLFCLIQSKIINNWNRNVLFLFDKSVLRSLIRYGMQILIIVIIMLWRNLYMNEKNGRTKRIDKSNQFRSKTDLRTSLKYSYPLISI